MQEKLVAIDTNDLNDSIMAIIAAACPKEKVVETVVAKTPTPQAPTTHTVKQGDTLSAIARKYHTTVDKLCKLNRIKEDGILSLGQKIKVR